MNKVILWGRLGDDPKPMGQTGAVVQLRVGTRESAKQPDGTYKDETMWHTVVCFGKTAEHVTKFLHKGAGVTVDGAIRTSSYEKNGEKKWSTQVVAHRVGFTDPRPAPGTRAAPAPAWDGCDADTDDIPF